MAKFCGNCGNPVEQGAVFCDNCGARLDSFTGEAPSQQQFTPRPVQQSQYSQPVQQVQYNNENTYSQAAEPTQKKKKLLPLIIGGVAVLLVVVIVIVAVAGKSGKKDDEINPVEGFEEIVIETSESTTQAQTTTESTTEKDDRPDFEKYGMVTNIKKDKAFDVVAKIKGTDKIITGKGKLKSFKRESVSKEIVEFMKANDADVSGYERLKVSFVVEFPKSILNQDSMTLNGDFTRIVTDYYDIDLYSDSSKTLTDTEGETYYRRKVSYKGKNKKIYFWLDSSANLEGDKIYYHDDRTFLVPKGYDGIVVGYRDVSLTEQRIYKDYDKEKYDLYRLGNSDKKKDTAKKTTKKSTTKKSDKKKETLPYSNLGKPRAEDFAWIADAQSGSLSGKLLGKKEFIGKWKAEIILDGVYKLANITIAKDATVTIKPYKVNTGNGWKDDTDGKQKLKGEFDHGGAGNIFAIGDYGNLDLYKFMESNGTQYGLGTLSLPSGENADVYLVRK